MFRYSRWLIFAPVAILALFAPTVHAEPVAGLTVTGYIVSDIPPPRNQAGEVADIHTYTECGSEVLLTIDWDDEPFQDCPIDGFMLHFQGQVTFDRYAKLLLYSDDGGMLRLNGAEVYATWYDQGCSPFYVEIDPGVYDIDVWMYENGGGSCVHLMQLSEDTTLWNIVDSFTTNGIPTTTSTSTTTTIQETSTTWESTTTFTTQVMTTSTIAQSTTVPVTSVPTTMMPQITSTYPPEPTMPEPPAVVPLLPIVEPATLDTMPLPPEIESFPPETLELPPYIVDTMPFPVDTYPSVEPPDTLPFVGNLFDTMPEPPDTMPLPPDIFPDAPETLETLPIAILEELPPELVEALQNASEDVSLTEEQFDTVLESIQDLDEAEAVALIEQILNTAVTSAQATELASNPDVLAVVTSEQATEIFETLDVTVLDNTQLDALVDAVQDAPTQVRNAFEETINIFDDGLGNYVPLGSTVPVDTRRTLIAVAAGAATVAAGQRRNK
jgi:hypothetical protein